MVLSGSLLVPAVYASAGDTPGNTPMPVEKIVPGSSSATKEEKLKMIEQMIAENEASQKKLHEALVQDQESYAALQETAIGLPVISRARQSGCSVNTLD
ncbi:MAG: hypothetical protein ACK50V_07780 [Alphaproteobacteria bacterium]|nr:hypothetical protein [Alphaproteobacteria bacterium]